MARPARPARRAGAARRCGRARLDDRLALERGLLHERAHRGRDRGLDLRLRRQLGRALVRPDQLRRRRCLRFGGDDGAARVEEGRADDALPAPARPHDRERAVAAARRGPRRPVRVPRRAAADAAVRPRRRDRDPRGARDHEQRASAVDEDRPRRDDALARAGVDRAAAGDARRAGRDRGRVRLPAQPPRPAAARLAGGSGRGRRRRRASPPAAPLGVHPLRCARRLRRRPARAPARLDHDRPGLPRADLPDAGDAGRRRRDESLGRGRRRAGGERPRLVPEPGRERRSRRSAIGSTCLPARGSSSWRP